MNAAATDFLREELGEDGDRKCDLCGEVVPFEKEMWRGHIGWHILRALCGAPEQRPLISPVCHSSAVFVMFCLQYCTVRLILHRHLGWNANAMRLLWPLR